MILYSIVILVWTFCIYTIWRANRVRRYFDALLKRVGKAADFEIANHDYLSGTEQTWPNYYVALKQAPFIRAVYSFKPIPSFFQGTILESDGLLPTKEEYQ